MLSRISRISRASETGGGLGWAAARSASRWHFLYFLRLPHQHAAFLGSFMSARPPYLLKYNVTSTVCAAALIFVSARVVLRPSNTPPSFTRLRKWSG